ARGKLQASGGTSGIQSFDFPDLNVLSHQPTSNERDVSTELGGITIELSAVLDTTLAWEEKIRVYQGYANDADVLMGTDVTDQFVTDFVLRNDQPNHRKIVLTPTQALETNTR